MIKIKGNYVEAIIYSNELDNGTEGVINALCSSVIAENSKIRVMQDVHPGKGCTVGMTITFNDRVIRKKALIRLETLVKKRKTEEQIEHANDMRISHVNLERGNAVAKFEGVKFQRFY